MGLKKERRSLWSSNWGLIAVLYRETCPYEFSKFCPWIGTFYEQMKPLLKSVSLSPISDWSRLLGHSDHMEPSPS